MKMTNTFRPILFSMILAAVSIPGITKAQDQSQERIINDSKEAKASFKNADPSMETLFKNSAGYVIFPNVGKGGIGVGGAAGKGTVFQRGVPVGTAEMIQATVGAQVGGQAYREIIFFENQDALDRFVHDRIEFSGQVSAIAVKSGAAADARYRDNVVVFSQEKGGLMVEASLGGQKFTYKALK
jgi:lipid-binding SYLF domain-containing protein